MLNEFVTVYQIPEKTSVAIFGASATGQWIAQALIAQGHSIPALIDNHADGHWNDIPVLKPEAYAAIHHADTMILTASHAHDALVADLGRLGLSASYRVDKLYDFQRAAAAGRMFGDLGYANGPTLRRLFGHTQGWHPNCTKLDLLHVAEQAMAPGLGLARYVVNLGCFDGKTGDPCYPLFVAGYTGMVVDAIPIDDPRVSDIATYLPYARVRKVMDTPISPTNVVDILQASDCPQAPVMLKIDIDGYDAPVLNEILKAGYRPGILRMEVNADMPPDVRFSVRYHPAYLADGRFGFYGCSLGMVMHLVRPHGYELVELDFGYPDLPQGVRDITLVRRDLLPVLGLNAQDEVQAYYKEPLAFSHFYADLGVDPRQWRHRDDRHALFQEIWQACTMASMARHGQALPFVLDL
jgi:hypothetical protein